MTGKTDFENLGPYTAVKLTVMYHKGHKTTQIHFTIV